MKRRWASRILFGLMVIVGLFSGLTPLEYVRGNSMAPTLKSGQWLLVANYRVLKHVGLKVHRGEIITFANDGKVAALPARQQLVKRVLGAPRDLIGVSRTTVFRNSHPIKEPYVKHAMNNATYQYDGRSDGGQPFSLPGYQRAEYLTRDQYFVLGDNRPVSADSRWFGPINGGQINGVVLAALPISRSGWVQEALWALIHVLPTLLVLAWFGVACWPDLVVMLKRPEP